MSGYQERVLQDRRVAYAITDRSLRITDVSGASEVFVPQHGVQQHGVYEPGANGDGSWIGQPLYALAPELVGSEDALQQILAGNLARLQIPWVNRDAPDGSTAYHTLVDLPYHDESGAISGVIHIVQDVTESGELEQRLMQHRNTLRVMERTLREQNVQLLAANAELRRLDEAKSAFVSIAAHELRTPLASISGYIEMLLDGDAGTLNARQAEFLGIMEASATRLLRLTRDLLDVARLQSGRLELLLKPTDLRGLVASVIAEQRPELEARGQKIELVSPGTLPLALVDRGRAAQMVANLVGNASKFSPPTTLIRVVLEPVPDMAGYLRVTVEDEGPGIEVQDQASLFHPFVRGSGAIQSGQPGSGLGLYITKSLVELHGGQIWLVSQPGAGTRVSFTLPLAEALPTEP